MQHTNKKIEGQKFHNTFMQRINFFQLFIVKSNAPLEKKEKNGGDVGTFTCSQNKGLRRRW
jgi:hypothetical protein